MGAYKGLKYNGAIDRVKIENDTTYVVNNGQGLLKQHNLFNEIPEFFFNADYIVFDPPWNSGNLKSFYTKADLKLDQEWFSFIDRIFELIGTLNVNSCYMEFGEQWLNVAVERMKEIFDNVRVIESLYYNKNKCYFIIGENEGHEIELENVVKDELKVIDEIISKKEGTVLDFCLGRGAVSRTAYKYNKKFIGTELNINRLAVSYEDLLKMGAKIDRL